MTGHDGMDFSGHALMDTRWGRWCDLDLRIPVPSNRRFACRAGVANAKIPRLLVFARHVEIVIIEAQKPRSTTLLEGRTLFSTTGVPGLEKNPPCNAEQSARRTRCH